MEGDTTIISNEAVVISAVQEAKAHGQIPVIGIEIVTDEIVLGG